VWDVVVQLERSGRLSYQAVVERLHQSGQLGNIGADVNGGDVTGEAYLQDVMKRGSPASVQEWADNVTAESVRRNIRMFAAKASLDADSDAPIDEVLDALEQQIYGLRKNTVNTGNDMGTILRRYEEVMDGWRDGTYKPAFTLTTPHLERLIPFLEAGDFMLIAGRPGEGKSSILRSEAFQGALSGKKVVIFNLENGEIEYARYLIATVTGIDTFKLRKPKELNPGEVADVRKAIEKLLSIPLKIVTLGAPTVFEIIRIARKLLTQGFEVFMVDYIQLIKNGIENEVQDLSVSSTMLRGFALRYNVPVIAAAQLSREITRRTSGEPQLSDLRGSGSLEQDALIVVFTQLRDATEEFLRRFPQNLVTGEFIVRAVPMRLCVRKNRNGPIDDTPDLLWDKAINKFYPFRP
jgi:replicative DNA helicase